MGSGSARWKRVKFGEVVRQVKTKVDPESSGIARYVAGEHMDSDDLRIRRWGEVGDGYLGPAFHVLFKPGQVLYGSRRTYLRKVAIADFEGICANTTFVLESADHTMLLPEFLPFVMQDEAFHEHSKRESKGSVNPYVNFSDLAWYGFALPPLDEQRRLVRLLAAANLAVQTASEVVDRAKIVVRAALDAAFGFPSTPRRELIVARDGWRLRSIADLADPDRPISYGVLMPGDSVDNGVPMLRIMDFDEFGRRTDTAVLRVARSVADSSPTTYVRPGDLIVSVMATIGRSLVTSDDMNGWNMNRALTLVPCADAQVAELLDAYFQSGFVQRLLWSEKIGSAQPRINLGDLKTLPVPVPPKLNEVTRVREQVLGALRAAEKRHCETRAMASILHAKVLR
jgi:type I restriction enzyme S subunit